jgi:hypothetical protein
MKRIHFVIAIVGISAVLIISGAALAGVFDPLPKRAILKVQDMESITDLHGNWTQATLEMLENPSSPPNETKYAMVSATEFEYAKGSYSFGIVLTEMYSAEQAEEQYYKIVSPFQNDSLWNQTAISSIGDGGTMLTYNSTASLTGCWVFFHKGVYVVEMLGTWNVSEIQSIMLRLAEAQADRL